MFKKIISYTIIFSIFYSDYAFCMEDSELGGKNRVSTKRATTENTSLFNADSKNLHYSSFSSSSPATPSPRSNEELEVSPSKDGEKLSRLHFQQLFSSSDIESSSDESKDGAGTKISTPVTKDDDCAKNKLEKSPSNDRGDTSLSVPVEDRATEESTAEGLASPSPKKTRPTPQATNLDEPTSEEEHPEFFSMFETLSDTETQQFSGSVRLPDHDQDVKNLPPLPAQLTINGDLDESSAELSVSLETSTTNKTLLNLFKKLSNEGRTALKTIKFQDIQGKYSLAQWAALIVGGGLIGAGATQAIPAVYGGGIAYVDDKYHTKILYTDNGAEYLEAYLMLAAIFDVIPRNATLWKKAVTHVAEQGIEKTRIGLSVLASFLPSLLEPALLVITEMKIMEELDLNGIDNPYAQMMLTSCPCPFLFADSFAFNYDMTWEATEEFKEWLQYSRYGAYCFSVNPNHPSPWTRSNLRHEYSSVLDKLSRHVFNMHADEPYITSLYDTISSLKMTTSQEFSEIEEDNKDAAQSFFLIHHLLSLGYKVKDAIKHIKSWYETITDGLTYGILAVGSPVRFFTLELAIGTFLEFFTPEEFTQTCSLALAAVGFLPLTAFEYKGLTKFFRDFLWHENPHAHGSHPYFRIGEKALSAVAGLIFVMPLLVLSIEASDKWFSGDLWMKFLAIPYLLAEAAVQTTSFDDSYNRKVGTGITTLYNEKIKKDGPSDSHKKDVVLDIIASIKERVEHLPMAILEVLEESLNVGQRNSQPDESGELWEII